MPVSSRLARKVPSIRPTVGKFWTPAKPVAPEAATIASEATSEDTALATDAGAGFGAGIAQGVPLDHEHDLRSQPPLLNRLTGSQRLSSLVQVRESLDRFGFSGARLLEHGCVSRAYARAFGAHLARKVASGVGVESSHAW